MLKIVVTLTLVLACLTPSLANDPKSATGMAQLITEVNNQRAGLKKNFITKLTELTVTGEDETKLKAEIACAKLTDSKKSHPGITGTKFAISKGKAAWTKDNLKAQIGKDFTTAKGQLKTADNTCNDPNSCGLAKVLLAKDITEISLWTNKCGTDYYLIYVVKPDTAVGKEMNKAGTKCIDGYEEKSAGQTTTKLCEKSSNTGGGSDDNSSTTTTGAASLVTCPLLVLTAFLTAGARLRG